MDLIRDSGLGPHLVSLERLTEDRGRRTSGLPALDRLLGGGWPRAALSEISGRRSSGRTTVVQAALAAAIAAGETVALVDAGGSLDARAWTSGTELGFAERSPSREGPGILPGFPNSTSPPLLWIRCAPPQALKAADLVVAAGGFGMVALDLCDATLRIPDAAWVRLRHTARAQGTTILIAGGTHRLGSFAAAAIDLGGAPAFDAGGPPLFTGIQVDVRARRARVQAENENAQPCASLVFTSRS